MSAYLVVLLELENPDWVKDYLANVPDIMRKFGGEYAIVSKKVTRLEGEGNTPSQIALVKFPSTEVIEEFLSSAEYEPYAKARIAGSYSDFFAIET